jgi:tagaturonate epimerase
LNNLDELDLPIIESSTATRDNTIYCLIEATAKGEKKLLVAGNTEGFDGKKHEDNVLICPLSPQNAQALRQQLDWLKPTPLGTQISAGFGDRLGSATAGHVLAVEGTGVAPIFAQQSTRENTRIGRTAQQVMDDAMWGVFQSGWREPWGADADHMKTIADLTPYVEAGYTLYTIDPSDHVDDDTETDSAETLAEKAKSLPWEVLQSSIQDTRQRLQKTFDLKTQELVFDEAILLKAMVKHGAAVAHAMKIAQHLVQHFGDQPFDLEMSVDETDTTTSLHEHFYIVSELKRLGVSIVSLAPRFVGSFEKGVEYIGDINELEENIAGHAAIMRYFDNGYKLSLHTGSDKFTVYPIAAKHTQGLVHLKTAGTSYLEALRLIAAVDPQFFRTILDFSRGHFEEDRKTYHISALLDKVPTEINLTDEQLPDLLNQFDAREVLHVTFGSVLDQLGDQLRKIIREHEAGYHANLKTHFDKHLVALRK